MLAPSSGDMGTRECLRQSRAPLPVHVRRSDQPFGAWAARSVLESPFGRRGPVRSPRARSTRTMSTCEGSRPCIACSPVKLCPKHAPLPWSPPTPTSRRTILPPRGSPISARSSQLDAEYSPQHLDPVCRAHVLASVSHMSYGYSAPTLESQRVQMGGDKSIVTPRLDTNWNTEACGPRSRVRCMLAAGWLPVNSTPAHPRFERTLQTGPHAGLRQVINFSHSYSVLCWDMQSADLQRMDRVARGEY